MLALHVLVCAFWEGKKKVGRKTIKIANSNEEQSHEHSTRLIWAPSVRAHTKYHLRNAKTDNVQMQYPRAWRWHSPRAIPGYWLLPGPYAHAPSILEPHRVASGHDVNERMLHHAGVVRVDDAVFVLQIFLQLCRPALPTAVLTKRMPATAILDHARARACVLV